MSLKESPQGPETERMKRMLGLWRLTANIKHFFLMLVIFMHRISSFVLFFITKINTQTHFKSGLTVTTKPRQRVSPLFYTVGTVYSDVLWYTFLQSFFFSKQILGHIMPPGSSTVFRFKEHCTTTCTRVGEFSDCHYLLA